MGLLILLFIVVVGGTLAVETLILVATGNWRWDDYVSRTSKLLWLGGFGVALVLAAIFIGPAALSAWPVWIALPVGTFAVFKGLDLWHGVGRPRVPRVIEHADGRRAVVDGRVVGYQALPAAPRREDPLAGWLQEKV